MGFPIREYTFFFQQAPGLENLKSSLCTLTGLSLSFEEIKATAHTLGGIEISYPKLPKDNIIIEWASGQNDSFVRVWSETRQIGYLEISTIHLLKTLGGRMNDDVRLPSWAGKKWVDLKPVSPIAKIKNWWNSTFHFK